MASDVISHLHLETMTKGRVIVAKETKGCDSSFITSCILSHCVKNKLSTLLILLHHPVSHYQNIGLRMFYNLQKSVDTGLIETYNLGEEHLNLLLKQNKTTIQDSLFQIKAKLSKMRERYDSVNIIVDGITHLFDMNISLQDGNWFCRQLINEVKNNQSFLLFHSTVSGADDITYMMTNLLCHMSYTILEVESLASGWSSDVSGHLYIKHPGRKYEEDKYTIDLKPAHYHFKLFDKGVKLFAPGAV